MRSKLSISFVSGLELQIEGTDVGLLGRTYVVYLDWGLEGDWLVAVKGGDWLVTASSEVELWVFLPERGVGLDA